MNRGLWPILQTLGQTNFKIELLGYKSKWWEKFVPDLERDLIESVCHQVLDIYSGSKKKTGQTPAKTPAKRSSKLSGGRNFSEKYWFYTGVRPGGRPSNKTYSTVEVCRLHRDRLLQDGRLLQENIKIDFSILNFDG